MPIAKREVGDVLILDISGRLSLGEGSDGLRDAIEEAVIQGKQSFSGEAVFFLSI